MRDVCISVTTFRKLPALRGWLESLVNLDRVAVAHVADDNDGEAQPVAEEFQARYEAGTFPVPVVYSTGPNGGISKNKNRGLKFFLTAPEAAACPYLVLSDDDIVFTRCQLPGFIPDLTTALVTAAEQAGLKHVTGYLGGSFGRMNADGTVSFQAEPFFSQFPPKAEDSLLYYTLGGTQGILLFFHRGLVEQLGYFSQFPGRYGYEHADYSMRANRLEGRTPELYPILKNCPEYFHCQGIPNNYEAHPEENAKEFDKRRVEVYNGVGLSKGNSGV